MENKNIDQTSKIELRSGTLEFKPREMIKKCQNEYNNFIDKINQCNNLTRFKAEKVTRDARKELITCCTENYLNSFKIN